MNYKRKLKALLGVKMQRHLSYFYHVLHHDNSIVSAMKKLSDNKKFYGIHQGKRCFILGNGPSLKEVPLECLEDEYVFTVNYFNKIPNYRAAKTNYHIWMDPVFFNLRDDLHADMREVMECYDAISREKCECFFPLCAYSFLEVKGLLERITPHFFYMDATLSKEESIKMDICNVITLYTTVVQYAITIAIYMGFSEIYLAGCDSTYLLGVYNKLLEVRKQDLHAYDNDSAGEAIGEILKHYTMSEILQSEFLLFLGYEKLYEYCKEKGIALFNCSARTVVTSVPRIDLENVLYGK